MLAGWVADLTSMQRTAADYETQAKQALQAVQSAESNPALGLANQHFDSEDALRDAQNRYDTARSQLTATQGDLAAIREDAERLLRQHQELADKVAATYGAAGLFRSLDDARPVLALVQCYVLLSQHHTVDAAIAGLTELHEHQRRGTVDTVHLESGAAVLVETAEKDFVTMADRVSETEPRSITAWIPDPAGTCVVGIGVSSNNVEDWQQIQDLAHGIFNGFDWVSAVRPATLVHITEDQPPQLTVLWSGERDSKPFIDTTNALLRWPDGSTVQLRLNTTDRELLATQRSA